MAMLSRLKRALTHKRTEVVTFSRLDYWTMLELFDHIPLHDLVRLNGLASWWSGYVDKVCLTKRSITVNCGYKADRSITCGGGKDTLKVVTIDSTTSDRLGHLLPNITSLEVILGGSQAFCLSDVTYLIRQWSHQLVDLKLECDDTLEVANYANNQFTGLLLSLKRITTLRRLTIHSESVSLNCLFKDPIDLPILAQLEYFYFSYGEDNSVDIRDSVAQYAGRLALKQIGHITFQGSDYNSVHTVHIALHNGGQLLEKQPFSKFRMLRNLNTRYKWTAFAKSCNFFHLGLNLNSRSHFMDCISHIHLGEHTVSLTFFIDTGFDRNSGQVLANHQPMHSVTKLELNIVAREMQTNSYSAFKSLKVDLKMFPNVQAVHLELCHLKTLPGPTRPLTGFTSMIWRKISIPFLYRKLKRLVRQDFPNVKCSFQQRVYDLRDTTL